LRRYNHPRLPEHLICLYPTKKVAVYSQKNGKIIDKVVFAMMGKAGLLNNILAQLSIELYSSFAKCLDFFIRSFF
jgi:hypothetical protein